jgi:hypothetical protein
MARRRESRHTVRQNNKDETIRSRQGDEPAKTMMVSAAN